MADDKLKHSYLTKRTNGTVFYTVLLLGFDIATIVTGGIRCSTLASVADPAMGGPGDPPLTKT